jgi:hypothetical protein
VAGSRPIPGRVDREHFRAPRGSAVEVPSLTEGSIKRSRKFAVVRPTFRTATAHKVLRVKTAPAPNDQLQLGFRRVIARYRLAEPDLTYIQASSALRYRRDRPPPTEMVISGSRSIAMSGAGH